MEAAVCCLHSMRGNGTSNRAQAEPSVLDSGLGPDGVGAGISGNRDSGIDLGGAFRIWWTWPHGEWMKVEN